MNEDQVGYLFAALAHEGRRRMLDLVTDAPGMSVKALASHFDMSRIAVLKHVQILEHADLLLTKKRGRPRHLYFNPLPIQLIHDRWTTRYSAFWSGRMADIKTRVEGRAKSKKEHKSA